MSTSPAAADDDVVVSIHGSSRVAEVELGLDWIPTLQRIDFGILFHALAPRAFIVN